MDSRKRNVRFDQWLHDEIETMAKDRDRTFTDIVNFLLEDELNSISKLMAKRQMK